jgi:hypothetical protein
VQAIPTSEESANQPYCIAVWSAVFLGDLGLSRVCSCTGLCMLSCFVEYVVFVYFVNATFASAHSKV